MIKTFILHGEDDRDMRDSIRYLLEGTGAPYSYEECKDGKEFNLRIKDHKQPIDIAILDIHMPYFKIISAVKKLSEEWPHVYVIVASGDDDMNTILELQNVYHIWGYVLKGKTDFADKLKRLVADAHYKVQKKNEYFNHLLAETQTPYEQR